MEGVTECAPCVLAGEGSSGFSQRGFTGVSRSSTFPPAEDRLIPRCTALDEAWSEEEGPTVVACEPRFDVVRSRSPVILARALTRAGAISEEEPARSPFASADRSQGNPVGETVGLVIQSGGSSLRV